MSTNSKIVYENLGKKGNPTTKTICIIECDMCHEFFRRRYLTLKKHQADPLIAGNFCAKCFPALDVQREKVKRGLSSMLKEDPDWRQRNSRSKKGKINLGQKNGMKQEKVRQKVSEKRKKMLANPDERRKISIAISNAWASGKYRNAKVGKCKWFKTKDTLGNEINVQGTWELAYAKWLVLNNIEFLCHKGRLSYNDDTGFKRNYYPDFYLIKDDIYVDIKNRYHFEKQKRKFEILKEQHPNTKILLLFKKDLDKLGVFND